MMPRVSVVIPAYNAMNYLPKTLDSVLAQTFSDFEVLIINDGSTDHITQWATEIPDHRIKLISQENQGLPGARNTGISKAQGEYIAFIDADDLWKPTKLEKQVKRFEENASLGLVYTWTTLIDSNDQLIGTTFNSTLEGDIWQLIVLGDVVGNGSSAMVRRTCFEQVGTFDPSLTAVEDWDMWIRIASSYPVAVVKEYLTLYRQHAASMSRNRQKILENLHIVIEKTFKTAPPELLHLKSQAYGQMNQCQAWVALYSGDHKQAIYFQNQALIHHPKLQHTKGFRDLSLGISIVRLFGEKGYLRLKHLSHVLRHSLKYLRYRVLQFPLIHKINSEAN